MMLGRNGSDMTAGTRPRPRGRSRHVFAVAVLAAVSLGAAACSSGGSATPTTASTTTVTFNAATEQTDVATVYQTLFNLSNPALDSKIAVIQDGSKISSALQDALSSSLASSASGAKVDSVTVLSKSACSKASLPSPCASVIYDILGPNASVILGMQKGYAVFSVGKWLVAKTTICGLLGLFYSASGKSGAPKGC
jgi:hypothetical protein